MNKRDIKRFLTALDAGSATDAQVAACRQETVRISEWLRSPAGRAFLFGPVAAELLREVKKDWLEHAEAYASAFASECGGLPEGKERLLVRLLMDFANRGYSAVAAPIAANRREAGVLFAEEGREKIAKTTGREVEERRQWVRHKYAAIRPRHKSGSRGDRAARAEVIREHAKAFGWLDKDKKRRHMSDLMVRRYLSSPCSGSRAVAKPKRAL